ncbi:hypothetical protein BC835DRAFT_360921 [Cytidiella melzeri]|nr:hypothetical protein BC835DRAFT_360921 [Cytidiella melzeri]
MEGPVHSRCALLHKVVHSNSFFPSNPTVTPPLMYSPDYRLNAMPTLSMTRLIFSLEFLGPMTPNLKSPILIEIVMQRLGLQRLGHGCGSGSACLQSQAAAWRSSSSTLSASTPTTLRQSSPAQSGFPADGSNCRTWCTPVPVWLRSPVSS